MKVKITSIKRIAGGLVLGVGLFAASAITYAHDDNDRYYAGQNGSHKKQEKRAEKRHQKNEKQSLKDHQRQERDYEGNSGDLRDHQRQERDDQKYHQRQEKENRKQHQRSDRSSDYYNGQNDGGYYDRGYNDNRQSDYYRRNRQGQYNDGYSDDRYNNNRSERSAHADHDRYEHRNR